MIDIADEEREMDLRQVLYFDSPTAPYRADATVLACFDARFQLATRKVLKRLRLVKPDVILVAGGPRSLASGTDEERMLLLEQFRRSHRLHGSTRALLIAHSDCGAYGGLSRFDGDRDEERKHACSELERAAATLDAAMGVFEIECCFMDFERVWVPPLPPSS